MRWVVLLPGLALASFAGSAALVDLGWGPAPSLVGTAALLAVLLAAFLRRERSRPWRLEDWGWTSLATFAVAGVCTWLLWIGAFRGMPAIGGGDAGDHVALGRAFLVHEAPGQHGMGAYYTLSHGLERVFGASPFETARGIFYGCVATTIGLCAACGAHLARRSERRSPKGLLGRWVAIALPACLPAVLPLLHYYQADGFLPQTLSLVVLVAAAVGYAGIEQLRWRIVALVLALGMLRYTYVLNAGETLLTCAAVIAWELWSGRSRAQLARTLVVLLPGLGLAAYGWHRITSADGFSASDGIIFDQPFPSVAGLLLLSMGALLVPWCHQGQCSAATRRLAGFVGLFGLLSAGTRALWLLHFGHPFYYECKQGFAPIIVVTLGLSLLLAERLTARVGTVRTTRRAVGTVILLAVAGLALTSVGASPYWPSFAERVLERRTFQWLTPLLERRTETEIQATLARGGHRFGGFLTPRWPESSFTNAAFGEPRRSWNGADAIRREAGFCAFWYAPTSLPPERAYLPRHHHTLARLEAGRVAPCVRFTPEDGFARELSLCHRCFGAHDEPAATRQIFPIADEAVAHAGFHDLETEAAERWRWTDGDGRIQLKGGWPAGQACELVLNVQIPRSLEVWLGDTRLELDDRGRCPLPADYPQATAPELRLRSPTFRPGPQDERDLGVQLFGVVIECQPG